MRWKAGIRAHPLMPLKASPASGAICYARNSEIRTHEYTSFLKVRTEIPRSAARYWMPRAVLLSFMTMGSRVTNLTAWFISQHVHWGPYLGMGPKNYVHKPNHESLRRPSLSSVVCLKKENTNVYKHILSPRDEFCSPYPKAPSVGPVWVPSVIFR